MKPKTCCVTGHRKIANTKIDDVKDALRKEIMNAISQGYTHFISGFAEGTDLYFAQIVADLKKTYSLSLEAALPYRKRMDTTNADFQRLIKKCTVVGIHSQTYHPNCFAKRNMFMVQCSELVIAVYDGRPKGGTYFTMKYAQSLGKEIKVVEL